MSGASQIISISNKTAAVSVDLSGGAIVDFHLQGGINPLTFKREGVNFQGHFLCLGRWGPPSAGEEAAGIVAHGGSVIQIWTVQPSTQKNEILMGAVDTLEGLRIERTMVMDEENAVFLVKEDIANINPLGRLFNVVQHPTIGQPFLTEGTVINCNSGEGFNYKLNAKPLVHAAQWPLGIMENGGIMNVSRPEQVYNSVFSYIVKKNAEFGWITAFSPQNNLLIGYLWKRGDYPWISLWQDFEGDNIRYRGLEFGTTGMHKSYKDIIEEGNHKVFDEDSYKYIDAGETQSKSYIAFMCEITHDFREVTDVTIMGNEIIIKEDLNDRGIIIPLKLDIDGF